MKDQLVEAITEIVLKELRSSQKSMNQKSIPDTNNQHSLSTSSNGMVKIWDHLAPSPKVITDVKANNHFNGQSSIEDLKEVDSNAMNSKAMNSSVINSKEIEPKGTDTNSNVDMDVNEDMLSNQPRMENPKNEELLKLAIATTPARIGIGRAGSRPKTNAWLKFRLDHAAAVDAVYGEVNQDILDQLELFSVQSKITTKEEYLRRPDLGRRLTEDAKKTILQKCQKGAQVQIIVADGLSSQAIESNVEDVYLSLVQSLESLGLQQGTPFFIRFGRVAVMDDIGELLQPEVVVLLIGERPGLVSAESLSAYLCYKPRLGTIEADRMVVSNIHLGGIPPVEAGAYLGKVVQKVLKYQASGVNLVKKEE